MKEQGTTSRASRTSPRGSPPAIDALERAARDEPHVKRRLIRALAPELVEALSPTVARSVTRTLRRHKGGRHDIRQEVDDFVQTALLALFAEGGALERWDPDRELGLGLERFVALVAAREVESILRSHRRNPWTEEPVLAETLDAAPASQPGPERVAGARRTLCTVAACLRTRVSPLGLTLFDMLFLQERAPEDIAATVDLAVGTVYAWRRRLCRIAREIVAEL